VATSLKVNGNEVMGILSKNERANKISFPLEKLDRIKIQVKLFTLMVLLFQKNLKLIIKKMIL